MREASAYNGSSTTLCSLIPSGSLLPCHRRRNLLNFFTYPVLSASKYQRRPATTFTFPNVAQSNCYFFPSFFAKCVPPLTYISCLHFLLVGNILLTSSTLSQYDYSHLCFCFLFKTSFSLLFFVLFPILDVFFPSAVPTVV